MIFMDPPDHDRLRAPGEPGVHAEGGRRPRADDPRAHPQVPRPARRRAEFDLVADFSGPFPVEVISVILGVPGADRQQIRHWTDEMLHARAGEPQADRSRGWRPGSTSGIYMHGPGGGEAPAPDRRHALGPRARPGSRDDEVAGFSLLLAGAGSETVTKLIGGGVVLFDRNPGPVARRCIDRPRACSCPPSRRSCATGRRRSTRAGAARRRRSGTA